MSPQVQTSARRGKPQRAPTRGLPQRQCSHCLQVLPETEEYFRRRPDRAAGWSSWCRACHRELAKVRQARRRADPAEKDRLLEEKGRRPRRVWGWGPEDWAELVAAWLGRCAYCGDAGELVEDLVDARRPLDARNVLPAHAGCVEARGDQELREHLGAEQLARVERYLSRVAYGVPLPSAWRGGPHQEAMHAEARPGRCVMCDGPVPESEGPRPVEVCSDDCRRARVRAYSADHRLRRRHGR